jgi:hypothetical protein
MRRYGEHIQSLIPIFVVFFHVYHSFFFGNPKPFYSFSRNHSFFFAIQTILFFIKESFFLFSIQTVLFFFRESFIFFAIQTVSFFF